MISDSNTRKFQVVLVWKLDRFSRNRFDSAFYKRKLSLNNVKVVSATEPISNTPEGIMLESLLEGMAEYYSAELAEKVSRGHKENALKGIYNGGPVPLGYMIDQAHHYQIDPLTAPLVKEVFKRYADGDQIKDLYQSLNARGLRTSQGTPFNRNSFRRLLQNRRYLVEYRYKDVVTPGAIPAIIDVATFDKVQARCRVNRQAHSHAKAEEAFILTTKAFCGECGALFAGESGKSHTGAVHYYYKCGTAKREGRKKCSMKPIRKEKLENLVLRTAIRYVLQDEMVDRIAGLVVNYTTQENKRLPALRSELREVNKKITNLIAAIEQGIISSSTKERLDRLEEQKTTLEISICQEELERPILTKEQVVYWFEQFKASDLSDIVTCKGIIDSFINAVYIYRTKIKIIFNFKKGDRQISFLEVKGSSVACNGAP